MTDRIERWAAVGAAIQNRIDELDLTWAELNERSGISFKTLKGYAAGEPIRRRDKKRELTRALHWTSDSIDRILDGLEPRATDRRTSPDDVSLLRAEMEAERAARRSEVQELRDQVEELIDQMDALGEAVDELRQQGGGAASPRAATE